MPVTPARPGASGERRPAARKAVDTKLKTTPHIPPVSATKNWSDKSCATCAHAPICMVRATMAEIVEEVVERWRGRLRERGVPADQAPELAVLVGCSLYLGATVQDARPAGTPEMTCAMCRSLAGYRCADCHAPLCDSVCADLHTREAHAAAEHPR